ncbi:MAG TPA: hypothetical protein VGX25_03330 [Actinophytocola sp.]|uniref:hypothetical protein n=1 Tax=Actinophytocola sp. TaxID=1872138 RepID=UPI002DDCEEE9|nr:hypothetical protein [Actinophytocola sp.]HEV2778411.1 hypothetical protein [Actinophytocola sp.]
MSTPLASRPAPSWLRDLTDARTTYEETLGWPVSLHITLRTPTLVTGATLTAITVPAHLGARVRQALALTLLPAPILTTPPAAEWTFLTAPVPPVRSDTALALAALHVQLAPPGTPIPLPLTPTTTTSPGSRWLEPPTPHRPLPPGTAVIATIRRLTHHTQQAAQPHLRPLSTPPSTAVHLSTPTPNSRSSVHPHRYNGRGLAPRGVVGAA